MPPELLGRASFSGENAASRHCCCAVHLLSWRNIPITLIDPRPGSISYCKREFFLRTCDVR
jgi:hypothetical protein